MHSEQDALSELFALVFAVRKELITAVGVLRGGTAVGVFATGASFEADFKLVVQVSMGIAALGIMG